MPIQVSPTKMSATDPKRIGGVWSFIKRFNDLVDWLASLSPIGATEYDTDWADITPVSALTGTVKWSRIGRQVFLWYDLNGDVTVDAMIVALPTVIRPAHIVPAAEYQYGTTGNRPGYLSLDSLRIPAQPGTTRRFGHVSYRVG